MILIAFLSKLAFGSTLLLRFFRLVSGKETMDLALEPWIFALTYSFSLFQSIILLYILRATNQIINLFL